MTKSKFDKYLATRLSPEDMKEIEAFAQHEYRTLKLLQEGVSSELTLYMTEKKIGFNELVRRLDMSPSQVSKIQKGEANLTLSSISHIFTILGRQPMLVFKSKADK